MSDRGVRGGYKTKSETVRMALGRALRKTDVLYDDYNGNLEEWKETGGTPVKALNGTNTPRNDMGIFYAV